MRANLDLTDFVDITTIPNLLRSTGDLALLAPGRQPLTHAELRRHAQSLAAAIRRAGVRRTDRVAVVLPNGPEMAVTFLGVVAAATCAPLNPAYRENELCRYFDDLRPALVIIPTGESTAARTIAEQRGIRIMECDARDGRLRDSAALDEDDNARPDDVALVLHTSGTTSRPKVVPLTHANLCASAQRIALTLKLRQSDRCLNVMPLFHIHGIVGALLSSLAAGASVVCTEGFLASRFLHWLGEFAPTWYTAVPTMHQAIAARAAEHPEMARRSSLRFIRSSSAPLPPTVIDSLERTFGVPVIEAYGMTEASHQMSSNPLPPLVRKPGSVGVEAGVELAILVGDVLHRPGSGTSPVGEVLIRGLGVTSGYADNPEATRQSFRDGWFLTGDLGHFDSDGYLFLTGRAKELINRGGEKITPREIDEALLAHPSVQQALAFAMPDPLLGEEVAAAIVLAAGHTQSESEIRAFAAERLADFKVPARIVFVDEIPKGPTGKPQRIGLADRLDVRGRARVTSRAPYRAPATATERLMCALWEEALECRVGVDDDFLDAGGDSMMAARILAALRSAGGPDVRPAALFDHPTPARFAAMLDAKRHAPASVPVPVERRPTAAGAWRPTSVAQESMWLLNEYEPEATAYVNAIVLRLAGVLNRAALRHAFRTVLERHEPLRSIYRFDGGRVEQRVLDQFELPWHERDVTQAEVEDVVSVQSVTPFDLTKDLPIRAQLLRLGREDYRLVIAMHHVAMDGWSRSILRADLAACYDAFAAGVEPALSPLAFHYGDFVESDRQRLGPDDIERQLTFWRRELAGLRAPRSHDVDASETKASATAGASVSLRVPPEVAEPFADLCRAERATLFMGLLTAFQIVLARRDGTQDVVVGSPVARRPRAAEALVGLFINTVALRTDLSGHPTFRDALSRVKATTLGALDNQDVPFAEVVRTLRPPRVPERTPIYQVSFQLRNYPNAPHSIGPLRFEEVPLGRRTSRLDLDLQATQDANGLALELTYRTDLYQQQAATSLLAEFQCVLETALADPDAAVIREAARATGIHQRVEGHARQAADRVALVDEQRRLTYGEVNRQANQWARRLIDAGIETGSRVALVLERSADFVIALLAVHKAGAAFVPLDPNHPEERLRFLLQDAGAVAVVTTADLAPQLASAGVPMIIIGPAASGVAGVDDADLNLAVAPDQLAYVIYTSGSTGQPKGVAVEHRQLVHYTDGFIKRAGLSELDAPPSFALVSTIAADLGHTAIFPALASGGTLHVIRADRASNGPALAQYFAQQGIDVLKITPSHLRALLDACLVRSLLPRHRLILGGEAARPGWVAQLQRLAPDCQIFNHYGPTETTVGALMYRVTADAASLPGDSLPLGTPLPNVRAYVLDAEGAPVQSGDAGELCIGGAGVSRGYLGRPDLTATRFMPDPFATEAGARLYRTGDRVRQLAGGDLEFLGRVDDQIKIRGFRLEPGEVESALRTHPAVREAVVVLCRDEPANPRLIAYWIGSQVETADLRRHLKLTLPDYAIPSNFLQLERWPLTPNGKIDRSALPQVVPDDVRPGDLPVSARTDAEKTLHAIWTDVLKVSQLGIHDDFFALGGHSLSAMQVVARIRDAFGVDVSLRRFFANSTIARLADVVADASDPTGLLPRIERRPPAETGPLSFSQEAFWFLAHLDPASATYNIRTIIRVPGTFDANAMARALNEVVRRHETLRTAFINRDGHPMAVILPAVDLSPRLVDLGELPDADREREWLELASEDARTPFDLTQAPLLRAIIVRLSQNEHVVVLTIHHIISDGESVELLRDEVRRVYEAFARQESSPLSELPIQFADYVHWLRGRLDGPSRQEHMRYWKQELAEAPTTLTLPTDRRRPAEQSFRGAIELFELPLSLFESIETLRRHEHATSFMTLMTAFMALMYRYSGQDDFLVATPISGRSRSETHRLIGLFLNTVVLRARVPEGLTFRALLRDVREKVLQAHEHQDLPFEHLVAELAGERTLGHMPLAQVLFHDVVTVSEDTDLAGLRRPDNGRAKFDLSMLIAEDRHHGWIEYSTDLFEAATIRQMIGHYGSLLAEMARDPDQPIATASMLSEAERDALLKTTRPANRDSAESHEQVSTLHERFEWQAEQRPGAPALTFEGRHVTYAELNTRSNQIAWRLKRMGVGPNALVGLLFERSVDLVAGILAVLKAGGAYVPIDPRSPRDRVALILDDADLAVVMTQSALVSNVPAGARVLDVDADRASLEREPGGNLKGGSTADDFAYVIYTSGSTGRPKGALVTHRNVARLITATQPWFEFNEHDVWTLFHSYAFDFSVWELWGGLWHGGRVVIVPHLVTRSPDDFYRLLLDERVTVLNQTPSAFRQLARVDEHHAGADLALRFVIFGGEALEMRSLAPWFDRHGDQQPRLVNMYGITETTVHVTYRPVTAADVTSGSVIGVPIPDMRVYVLDPHLQPVPIGVTGELYVSGAGVARGYLRRDDLTRQRFVPDPFADRPDAVMYRSGDLARYLRNGDLEYLGRIDNQVKIRGFRVELGEIEAALRAHPQVRDAVVLLRDEDPDDRRLVGYIIGDVVLSDLRTYLAPTLPDYAIPVAFVGVTSWPLTANGKLDRKALPAASGERSTLMGRSPFRAPATPTEQRLAKIWSDVLHIDRIGVLDDFFALGGHSLAAMQVVARVRDAFGVELSLRSFFANATIARLAPAVVEAAATGSVAQRIARGGPSDSGPLSDAQQALWFLDQLDPGLPIYNIGDSIRVRGQFDRDAMTRAINEVVRRHDTLRTSFVTRDGQPVAVVQSRIVLNPELLDASNLDADTREHELRRVLREQVRKPFDLARAPLLRVLFVRLADDDHMVTWVIHHIISDGRSEEILRGELHQLYTAFSRNLPSPLAELPIQFSDYVRWHRDWLETPAPRQQLAYWESLLAGSPFELALPTDKPRPAIQSHRGANVAFTLPPELAEPMAILRRDEQATGFMVRMTAFMALMGRVTKQDDLLVATPMSGRTHSETRDLIGYMVNTIVLRARLTEVLTFRSLLRQVREQVLNAHVNQDLPFDRVVAELVPGRTLSRSPLAQVMYHEAVSAVDVRDNDVDTGMSKLDLAMVVAEDDDVKGSVNYSTDLFEAGTIRRLIEQYVSLLGSFVRDPDQKLTLASVRIADPTPVAAPPPVSAAPNSSQSVHALVAAQARLTPHRTALACDGGSLTYDALNKRANQLARHLASLGVGPEVLVGVLVERSVDMVVAMLGILKAGAAYLPLDPALPEARLAFMVEDSGLRAIVTHRGLETESRIQSTAIIDLDAVPFDQYAVEDVVRETTGDELAYVLYTSGSTGQPKGVEITQSALVNLIESMRKEPGFTARDTLLAITTLSFDIAGLELYLPLVSGGRVVIANGDDSRDPYRLIELLREHRCTVMQATPTLWRAIVDAGWTGAPELCVLSGGEALQPGLAGQLLSRCAELWNLYGPTETTIYSTGRRITDAGRIDIGRPIHDTEVLILDEQGRSASPGVTGEILIGGAGVGRGYRNRPELTAERFVAHPFAAGQRVYRTGDRGRWLPDGSIEFLGRVDSQVKIRGFRVELGEIEVALKTHPGVREAVVLLREDVPGEPRLVAYVSGDVGRETLGPHVARTLPHYAVPAAFVSVESWPLTPNGKLDRKALPAPTRDRSAILPGSSFVEPRTPAERRLAAIWTELLGVPRVGATDDFFLLGGHSMLAMTLLHRIHTELGVPLPARAIFEHRTLEGLAARIAPREPNAASTDSSTRDRNVLVTLHKGGRGTPFFWVHGILGEVFSYMQVSQHLGESRPVFGFSADWTTLALDDKQVSSLESIAAHYVRELRAVQPNGPYHLGGFCSGAVVAIEMARQLEADGQTLGVVAALDYDLNRRDRSPTGARAWLAFAANLPRWILDDAIRSGWADLWGRLRSRVRRLWKRVDAGAPTKPNEALLDADLRDRLGMWRIPDYQLRMIATHHNIIKRHEARPMASRVALLLPRTWPLMGPWPTGHSPEWTRLTSGGVDVHRVAGSHSTMLTEPAAADVAAWLEGRIQASEADQHR